MWGHGGDHDGQGHAAHVDRQVPLPPVDQLLAVKPAGVLAHRLGTLDGLGVQDHRDGAGIEAVMNTDHLVQLGMDTGQVPARPPSLETP